MKKCSHCGGKIVVRHAENNLWLLCLGCGYAWPDPRAVKKMGKDGLFKQPVD